jgi:hypothetical protein
MDDPALVVRKSVLEGVSYEFIHNKPNRHYPIIAEQDLRGTHVHRDWPHVTQSITEVLTTHSRACRLTIAPPSEADDRVHSR